MRGNTEQFKFSAILIKDLGLKLPKENSKRKRRFGLFKCKECNCEFEAILENMKKTKDGKCWKCSRKKHGSKKTRLYNIWCGMKARCSNKKHKYYDNYGGKGIYVCKEWNNDFVNFKNWAENNGYSENLTIERLDNNKGYSKSNCVWATRNVQNRNKRKLQINNTSGFKGVTKIKNKEKWKTQITVLNKNIYLGQFDSPIEAAKEYDNYVIKNLLEHTRNFNGTIQEG